MEYRPIRPDESSVWRQFQEYCFHVPTADFDGYMAHKFRPEYTRALFGPHGQMLATFVNWPFQIYVDGAVLPMGGIASVASPPEHRRNGYVAELLGRSIREMKEQATPLSALYPFNQGFYRRLGWELACAELSHDIPPTFLARFRKYPGAISRYLPDAMDWELLEDIYVRRAPAQRGYMVRGSAAHWFTWVNPPHWNSRLHSAVWRPAPAARPEGYLLYWFLREKDRSVLVVNEQVALNAVAEQALLGFLANHDAKDEIIRICTSRDYPLSYLVDDTEGVRSHLASRWMLRIVDLKAALEARPWPVHLSGRITVGVQDDLAPWSRGTWQVELDSGRAAVSAAPTETPALSADIRTWAQLYAGFVTPAAACEAGYLASSDPHALEMLAQMVAGPGFRFFEGF